VLIVRAVLAARLVRGTDAAAAAAAAGGGDSDAGSGSTSAQVPSPSLPSASRRTQHIAGAWKFWLASFVCLFVYFIHQSTLRKRYNFTRKTQFKKHTKNGVD